MHYIVIDLEFNQCKSTLLKNEIIEIGAVKLNSEFKTISTFSQRVKPQINKKLDWKIKKVLKITQNTLNEGITFQNAIAKFQKWLGNNSNDYILFSWSLEDVIQLINNSKIFNLNYEWIGKFVDLQNLYYPQKQTSLVNAIVELQIPFQLDFHVALNDAIYTANILKKLHETNKLNNLNEYIRSLDYLRVIEELRCVRVNLINQMPKVKLRCPKCGRFAKKLKGNYKKKRMYIVLTYCENCRTKIRNLIKVKQSNGQGDNEKGYKLFITSSIESCSVKVG